MPVAQRNHYSSKWTTVEPCFFSYIQWLTPFRSGNRRGHNQHFGQIASVNKKRTSHEAIGMYPAQSVPFGTNEQGRFIYMNPGV